MGSKSVLVFLMRLKPPDPFWLAYLLLPYSHEMKFLGKCIFWSDWDRSRIFRISSYNNFNIAYMGIKTSGEMELTDSGIILRVKQLNNWIKFDTNQRWVFGVLKRSGRVVYSWGCARLSSTHLHTVNRAVFPSKQVEKKGFRNDSAKGFEFDCSLWIDTQRKKRLEWE